MPYATATDLIQIFDASELAQLTDESGLVDGTLLTLTVENGDRSSYAQAAIDAADDALAQMVVAVDDASSRIDGYLTGRYTLPLSSVPKILRRYTADLARYFLYDTNAPEDVRKRSEDAIRFLERVSEGKISIGVDDTGAEAETSNVAQMESDGRTFGRDQSKDYI